MRIHGNVRAWRLVTFLFVLYILLPKELQPYRCKARIFLTLLTFRLISKQKYTRMFLLKFICPKDDSRRTCTASHRRKALSMPAARQVFYSILRTLSTRTRGPGQEARSPTQTVESPERIARKTNKGVVVHLVVPGAPLKHRF